MPIAAGLALDCDANLNLAIIMTGQTDHFVNLTGIEAGTSGEGQNSRRLSGKRRRMAGRTASIAGDTTIDRPD